MEERSLTSFSFQQGLPSADVAVLFDASLSMRKHGYGEVRQAVITFASALTNKEIFHLRAFGDVAGAPLEGPADKLSGNVADHLPAEPVFNNTDLGIAISKGLDFLERPGANEVQALFLLTDGLHQPPSGSPYSRDFDHDPDWQALRHRARALCERHQVLIYGYGLGAQTDISLLLKLFPATSVEVVTGDAAQIAATLQRVRENLHLARLKRIVEQDVSINSIGVRFAPNVAVGGSGGTMSSVTIHNTYQHLPIVIDRVELRQEAKESRDVTCTFENAPQSLALSPNQQWQGRLRCQLQAASAPWRIGRRDRIHRSDWRLAIDARFSEEKQIARLISAPPTPRSDSPLLCVELHDRHGLPYWLIAASLLTFSSLAWLRHRQRRHSARQRAAIEQRQIERARLSGTLKLWPKEQNEPNDQGTDLSFYKLQRIDLVSSESGAVEIALPDGQPANVVAHLSGRLIGAHPNKAEAGKVEFRLETARSHRLIYEACGGWREATSLTLCDRDLIEIDGRWRLRYDNHRLRTRAEAESARNDKQEGGSYEQC